MIAAADRPVQRPPDAKLLAIDALRNVRHVPRRALVDFLRDGDLMIANDAATLPASLHGVHVPSGRTVEVRLAGWQSTSADDVSHFTAVLFGSGDYHTRTEHRSPPPLVSPGDRFSLGPLSAIVVEVLGHPRLVSLFFDGDNDAIWAGLAHHGRPIQYAHLQEPLALWDAWTPVAAAPIAFEPPSAGFVLDWKLLAEMQARGVRFATITHAAGISSTGDDELDMRLPLAEPYEISAATALAIATTKAEGGRVIAIGTTVVRALEHAASDDGVVRAGRGLATQRLSAASPLRVVDAVLSGIHEPGTSHYALLRAFVDAATLARADDDIVRLGYRSHEFGDSVFIERPASAIEYR
jgi:S-adenosylmethionine:tRNA ribosyltransferase-isomerase